MFGLIPKTRNAAMLLVLTRTTWATVCIRQPFRHAICLIVSPLIVNANIATNTKPRARWRLTTRLESMRFSHVRLSYLIAQPTPSAKRKSRGGIAEIIRSK